MKKAAMSFARKQYSTLSRIKTVRKAYRKARVVVRKQRARKQQAFFQEIRNRFKDATPQNCGFLELEMPSRPGDTYYLGFDALGSMDSFENVDHVEFFSDLKNILDNDDIDFRVAFFDGPVTEEARKVFDYVRDEMRLLFISHETSLLIHCGDKTVAMLGFDIPTEGEEGQVVVPDSDIKRVCAAVNANCDYIVAYGYRGESESASFTKHEQKYMRFLGNLGCRALLATSPNGLLLSGSLKTYDGRFPSTAASLGTILGDNEMQNGASLALRVRLIHYVTKKGTDSVFSGRGYIPLYVRANQQPVSRVMRIDYHNSEHRRDESLMKALEYIENETGKVRDVRNILTIQDVCDELGVTMPEEYAYLAPAAVGKICARSFEVSHGDVMFFLPPFADPNDGEPATPEQRMGVVERVVSRGVRFIFSYTPLDPEIPHVVIEDAREAHVKVCRRLRDMYEMRTIGITGSIGKTSTKDMLYNVLNQRFETHKNLRNSNVQVFIAMHMQDLRGGYEVFIQEIGGGRPGGASRHSRMIGPSACIVTNIGDAHIGNHGSREALMKNKLGVIDGMDEDGVLYLNGDDPLLRTAEVDRKTVFYAVDNHDADYFADNIEEKDGRTTFEIVHGDHRVPAVLNVLGHYNVLNAVASYAIGKSFGLTDEEIVEGLALFETSGTRQNLISVAGYNLFVDCFNASPDSVNSSLSVLDAMEIGDHKKIAVIGDITGAGELNTEIHEKVADFVLQHQMDILLCYGEESKLVHERAKAAGYNSFSLTEPDDFEKFLWNNAKQGDVILFKGSSKMRMTERIDTMFGTNLSEQGLLDKSKFRTWKQSGATFNLYPEFATVVGTAGGAEDVKIPNSTMARPILSITDGAFADAPNLRSIEAKRGVRHIGDGAFSRCPALRTVRMPYTVKYIGEQAFSSCSALTSLKFESGLMHIADRAFENCGNLTSITLPPTVTYMGEGVFDDCANLTVVCPAGSYVEQYCIDNEIRYTTK